MIVTPLKYGRWRKSRTLRSEELQRALGGFRVQGLGRVSSQNMVVLGTTRDKSS